MTEKQTFPQSEAPKNQPGEVLSDADYAMMKIWEQKDREELADAARRMVDQPLAEVVPIRPPQTATERVAAARPSAKPEQRALSPRVKRNRAIAGGILGATLTAGAAAGLGVAAHEALAEASFSDETTTYTVEQGDGIYAAADHIKGIHTIDERDAVHHIEVDPANIDVLKDGLQPGEQLTIPVSVEGYEQDK